MKPEKPDEKVRQTLGMIQQAMEMAVANADPDNAEAMVNGLKYMFDTVCRDSSKK